MGSVFDLFGKYNNLNDPVPTLNTRPAIFGLVIVSLMLSWLCASARLYTRYVILKCPGWDDLLIILVMITTLVLSVGTCLAVDHGLGQHFIQLSISGMAAFVKSFYIPNSTYAMSTAFIKLALLTQYLRILQLGSKLRRFTYFVIFVTACWGFAYSFIAWIPCWPVQAYWDWTFDATARWGFGSHDVGIFVGTYVSHVASNVVLDLVVFSIPLPLYFNPELTRKSRFGLCGLVVLGLVVNIFSIWRLVSIIDSRAGTSPTLDPSWYGSGPIVLAALEVNLAVICASLPVFWPVIEQNLGSIFVTREISVSRQSRHVSSFLSQDTELSSSPTHKSPEAAYAPSSKKDYEVLPRWLNFPLGGQTGAVTRVVNSDGQEVKGGSSTRLNSEPEWAEEHKMIDSPV